MSADPMTKIIRMANQIAVFMESKPHTEGLELLASHINDFWEPRMRNQLFSLLDQGGAGLRPLVIEAATLIKRPQTA
jgi:formate dehydrogenase subunit delta